MLKGVPSPISWIHEWRGRLGRRRQLGPKREPVPAAATCIVFVVDELRTVTGNSRDSFKNSTSDFLFFAICWLIDYGAPGGPKTSILHRLGTSCPYNSVTVNVLHCDERVTGFLID